MSILLASIVPWSCVTCVPVGLPDYSSCSTMADVDDSALTSVSPSKKRRQGDVPWYPPGPQTLGETLSHNLKYLAEMTSTVPNMGQDTGQALEALSGAQVVLTSSYSGTGCFEGVFHQIMKQLKQTFPDSSGGVACHAATDINSAAQMCLSSHKSCIHHVFGDILGRVPRGFQQPLKDIESSYLAEFKFLQTELKLGQLTKPEFGVAKRKLEQGYVCKLKSELSQIEFNDADFCLVHQKQCYISPRHDSRFSHAYWIEASGNTCCPWSRIGGQNGWLDVATLPFLVWCYSTRFFEPDSILQENVACFPEEEMFSIFQESGADVLKDLEARPLHPLESAGKLQRQYMMQSKVFSPTDLGIPCNRLRKYTAMHLSPWVKCRFGISFENLFFRELRADASIYLNGVPAAEHGKEVLDRLRAFGREAAAGRVDSDSHALSAGDSARLESWVHWAGKQGFLDETGCWRPKFALADVTQNAQFRQRLCVEAAMPCLLTHTLLFDLVSGRLVTACSHWLAQGFPHPAGRGVQQQLKAAFPFDDTILDGTSSEGLSYSSQRILAGNAMHWNAIGSWLLYNLSCADISAIGTGRPATRR